MVNQHGELGCVCKTEIVVFDFLEAILKIEGCNRGNEIVGKLVCVLSELDCCSFIERTDVCDQGLYKRTIL